MRPDVPREVDRPRRLVLLDADPDAARPAEKFTPSVLYVTPADPCPFWKYARKLSDDSVSDSPDAGAIVNW